MFWCFHYTGGGLRYSVGGFFPDLKFNGHRFLWTIIILHLFKNPRCLEFISRSVDRFIHISLSFGVFQRRGLYGLNAWFENVFSNEIFYFLLDFGWGKSWFLWVIARSSVLVVYIDGI